MCIKTIRAGLLAVFLLAWGGGCKKPEPPPPAAAAAALPPETVARVHWLGKDLLAAGTNAASLMKIWRAPESVRLEAQTLEKLSRAPWRLLYGDAKATNAANALLQPLLEDLVRAEWFLEVRQPTNQPAELALALRLNDQRARLWETNLAGVLESLAGTRPVPASAGSGWQLTLAKGPSTLNPQLSSASRPSTPGSQPSSLIPYPSSLSLTRSGDWTIVGLGQEHNALVGDFAARIGRDHAPFGRPGTNFWLKADLDLPRLARAFALDRRLRQDLPKASVIVSGDGQSVRTRGELNFSGPLPIALAPWIIPTNLVHSPLISFTAARGVGPLLGKIKLFADFQTEPVPDQIFLWDRVGLPFQTFFALPVTNSANAFQRVAPVIQGWLNSRLSSVHGSASINTNTQALSWDGVPFGSPFLRAVTNSAPQFLFGGFGTHFFARTNRMPPELLGHILERTNLVYYDWEFTGQRLVHWRYLDDSDRIVFDAAHSPRLGARAASLQWIANTLTNLSLSATELQVAAPNRLAFARKSTIGLTGLEIDILANWLELPEFPCGLHTLLATNPTPSAIWQKFHRGINAPAPR